MENKSTYNLLKENFGILLTISIIIIASTMYGMGRVAQNIVFDIVPMSQVIEKSLESYIFSGSLPVLIGLLLYIPLVTFFCDFKLISIYKIIVILFLFFVFSIIITFLISIDNKFSENVKKVIKKIEIKNGKFDINSKLYYVYTSKDFVILKNMDNNSIIYLNKNEISSIELYEEK